MTIAGAAQDADRIRAWREIVYLKRSTVCGNIANAYIAARLVSVRENCHTKTDVRNSLSALSVDKTAARRKTSRCAGNGYVDAGSFAAFSDLDSVCLCFVRDVGMECLRVKPFSAGGGKSCKVRVPDRHFVCAAR